MMNNFPKNWQVKTLAEVCISKNSNIVLKDIENNTGEYPIYGAKGFLKLIDFYIIENESLGIVKDGAGVGRVFLLPLKSSVIGTMAYIQVNENLNLKYLYHFLHTINFNQYISGSAIPHIYFRDYKKEKIPLPPLETQQKIVAKLESEFAKIESAKSHLEKVKETIPRLKNSLLKSAFSGELTQPYKDEKSAPYCHCEDSLESEAIYNAESPLKDSIAESKACKIVDCHELHCNFRNDESIAQTPSFTQAPNLGGATLVAQNPQNGTNPPDCHLGHSEETHKESACHSEGDKPEESHIADSHRDISHFSNAQYDNVDSCPSDLECNEREKSQRHLANTQYEKDSNLPQDWEIKTLGEITNYGKTTQKCPKDLKPDDWILELEDIKKESGILLNKITFEERQSKSNKIIFYKGDVLFGTLRSYLKKVIIADDNGYCSSEIMPFNSGNEITNHYLAYLFLSDFMGNKIATLTYGTRMPRLGTKNGRELQIPLPPLETQKQIVEILDSKFAALENLEKETNASLEKLQRLKSSLLNLVFKGELIC